MMRPDELKTLVQYESFLIALPSQLKTDHCVPF